jgi:hypothetical protein
MFEFDVMGFNTSWTLDVNIYYNCLLDFQIKNFVVEMSVDDMHKWLHIFHDTSSIPS